jgi:type IV fimbrial biogenesis protein FimT
MGGPGHVLGAEKGWFVLKHPQTGFTLIETMIGLVIVAVLLFAAIPQFSVFLHNQRLRGAAQGLSAGLQLARAEAVKRNARVEMILTNSDPIATLVNSATANVNGVHWIVRQYDPVTLFYNFIEGRDGATGTGMFDATPVLTTASVATIPFNNFGRTNLTAQVTITLTNPSLGTCAPSGKVRCLNILVPVGGQVRMCDPDSSLAAADTRRC